MSILDWEDVITISNGANVFLGNSREDMSYSGKSHIGIQSARQPNVSTQTIFFYVDFGLGGCYHHFKWGDGYDAKLEWLETYVKREEKSFQPPAIPSDFSLRPESNRSMIVCRNSDIVVTGRIRSGRASLQVAGCNRFA